MAEILLDGDRIHYIKSDKIDVTRPTILLLHGACQSIATWKFQLAFLKNHPGFNLIAPDLPGHGQSDGKGCRSVAEYKEFIKRFIDALGLEDIIPVGHSMAGGVAMLLALDHPEILSACVLVGTGVRIPIAAQTLEAVKNNYQSFCDSSPTRMFTGNSPQEIKQEYKADLLATSPEVSFKDLVACDEFDITDRIDSINVHTLIISGDLDILTPLKYGVHLHERIKGSSLYVMKGAGHFVMQERPEEFNRVLLEYLTPHK